MPTATAGGMFTISTRSRKRPREVQNTKAVAFATETKWKFLIKQITGRNGLRGWLSLKVGSPGTQLFQIGISIK